MNLPIQKDGSHAARYAYGSETNQASISPKRLTPVNFETARPSTRFPAMDTTIIANEIPVNELTREIARIVLIDNADILNISKAISVVTNAHIIGKPIRAVKYE